LIIARSDLVAIELSPKMMIELSILVFNCPSKIDKMISIIVTEKNGNCHLKPAEKY
jgi:hypothetical protein